MGICILGMGDCEQRTETRTDVLNESIKRVEADKIRIKTVDIDFNGLKDRLEKVVFFKGRKEELENLNIQLLKIKEKTEELTTKQTAFNKELEKIWKENPICPLCKEERTKKCQKS